MVFSTSTITYKDLPGIKSLNGTQITHTDSFKYLGIWIDSNLSFKTHIHHLIRKLKFKLSFLYRIKGCLSTSNRKIIVLSSFVSVLDYGDILYCHAAPSTLNQLNPVYHSALRFITNDNFYTHHCTLYQKVGWSSLQSRRNIHLMLFIYKALLCKLPNYLTSLLSFKSSNYKTRSTDYITLNIPRTRTNVGRTGFNYYAPLKFNGLQSTLKLQSIIHLGHFKSLLSDFFTDNCNCFC